MRVGRFRAPIACALPLLLLLLTGSATRAAAPTTDPPPPPPGFSPPAAPALSPYDSLVADTAPVGVATSHMIGSLLLEQGLAAEALPYLEYAWRSWPGRRLFADDYVAALAALGRGGEAIDLLSAEVGASPSNVAARRRLAALLADAGRFDEALREVAELRRLGADDPDLLVLEGEALAGAGRVDEAIGRLREALRALPERAEPLTLRLGELYRKEGRAEELAALWTEALTARPESRPIRMSALRDLVAAGRTERALAVAARGDSLQAFAPDADRMEVSRGGSRRRACSSRPDGSRRRSPRWRRGAGTGCSTAKRPSG